MRVRRRKNNKAAVIVIVILIALIALIFGNAVYKSVHKKYLYENYPIKYEGLVEKYSSENDIDKFLIYAIIRVESNFKSDAVSNVGARGLMQIMEETFEWIRFRLGDSEELSYDTMFDPEQNIRYGCYLVGYLMRYYENRDNAICAYHAGTGSVDSWLSKSEYSKDGVNLDQVPAADTNHYLSKVNNALNYYHKLYMEENQK